MATANRKAMVVMWKDGAGRVFGRDLVCTDAEAIEFGNQVIASDRTVREIRIHNGTKDRLGPKRFSLDLAEASPQWVDVQKEMERKSRKYGI